MHDAAPAGGAALREAVHGALALHLQALQPQLPPRDPRQALHRRQGQLGIQNWGDAITSRMTSIKINY